MNANAVRKLIEDTGLAAAVSYRNEIEQAIVEAYAMGEEDGREEGYSDGYDTGYEDGVDSVPPAE